MAPCDIRRTGTNLRSLDPPLWCSSLAGTSSSICSSTYIASGALIRPCEWRDETKVCRPGSEYSCTAPVSANEASAQALLSALHPADPGSKSSSPPLSVSPGVHHSSNIFFLG
ncbi:hypothetical protein AB1Y20_021764 [Prymnesium parvum]|uniref:Uncharacterized protein n=1 Tax=Prymnesium parvum TaxID=97485 RepID=A0AB34JMF9_PRYPA